MTQRIFDFTGFMDHSGSDELVGDPERWHSTAIAMAVDGHVFEYANNVVADLKSRRLDLGKWSKRSRKYRTAFVDIATGRLAKSKVFIAAFSARERMIRRNKDLVIDELGLRPIYAEAKDDKGRLVSRIGPVEHPMHGEMTLRLLEKRALMLFWIAHFVVRFYFQLREQWLKYKPETAGLMFHLWINKFIGDNDRNIIALEVFQGFASRLIPLRTSFFNESSVVAEELLADNLAGLVNEHVMHPGRYEAAFDKLRASKAFHYEIYD